jgi:hypothetical protein
MKDGWLWLSILKMQASPSSMSMTPAFSPGPQMTRGPLVGNLPRWIFDDLYEQCSDHITENTPNSSWLGSRPRRSRTTWYSAGLRPYSAASSAMDFSGALMAGLLAMFEAGVSPAGRRRARFGRMRTRKWSPKSPKSPESPLPVLSMSKTVAAAIITRRGGMFSRTTAPGCESLHDQGVGPLTYATLEAFRNILACERLEPCTPEPHP